MESLARGRLPFHEPGLQDLLVKNIGSGRFIPASDLEGAIRSGTVLFVCVGTPQRESEESDLSQVEEVTRMIARNLNGYKLVVEKSTVPAITAQWIKKTIPRYAKLSADGFNRSEGIRLLVPYFTEEIRKLSSVPRRSSDGKRVPRRPKC